MGMIRVRLHNIEARLVKAGFWEQEYREGRPCRVASVKMSWDKFIEHSLSSEEIRAGMGVIQGKKTLNQVKHAGLRTVGSVIAVDRGQLTLTAPIAVTELAETFSLALQVAEEDFYVERERYFALGRMGKK